MFVCLATFSIPYDTEIHLDVFLFHFFVTFCTEIEKIHKSVEVFPNNRISIFCYDSNLKKMVIKASCRNLTRNFSRGSPGQYAIAFYILFIVCNGIFRWLYLIISIVFPYIAVFKVKHQNPYFHFSLFQQV